MNNIKPMTPQDKANELIKVFSKELAIICVEEILMSDPTMPRTINNENDVDDKYLQIALSKDYWNEVIKFIKTSQDTIRYKSFLFRHKRPASAEYCFVAQGYTQLEAEIKAIEMMLINTVVDEFECIEEDIDFIK